MKGRDYSPGGLAQENLAHVLDLVPKVVDATYPISSKALTTLLARHSAIQFVAAEGGLFLIGWNEDGSTELYNVKATPEPVLIGGEITPP